MFLETIKIENSVIKNITFHQERFDETRACFFPNSQKIDLAIFFQNLPIVDTKKIYKLRLLYDFSIYFYEIQPYQPKIIQSLKIIHANSLHYAHKYAQRDELNQLFQKKELCDDVLIVQNNQITDTTYANIAFFDGEKWITPKNCLLKGTFRKFLLTQKFIHEQIIFEKDIFQYKKAKIFNSMLEWEASEIEIKNIIC
ncbi:MAG: chorismate-binding protein [Bacteroidetes bacterium]|nr:MAG: chorismate-binding protein [Bacteroidota bacterium]TAG89533.1 MAG: chorismate-binding protein [Bacteroidota bacterium]